MILAGVTKGFGPAQFDTRRTLTQGESGDFAGTFYLKLPGEAASSVRVDLVAAFGASTYDAEGVSSTAGNTAIGGSIPDVYIMPEPSTLILLGVCGVLLAGVHRRRKITAPARDAGAA